MFSGVVYGTNTDVDHVIYKFILLKGNVVDNISRDKLEAFKDAFDFIYDVK